MIFRNLKYTRIGDFKRTIELTLDFSILLGSIIIAFHQLLIKEDFVMMFLVALLAGYSFSEVVLSITTLNSRWLDVFNEKPMDFGSKAKKGKK